MIKPTRLRTSCALAATAFSLTAMLFLAACGDSDSTATSNAPASNPPIQPAEPSVETTFPTGLAVGSPAEISATATVVSVFPDYGPWRHIADFGHAAWEALKNGDAHRLARLAAKVIPIPSANAAAAVRQFELQAAATVVENVLSGEASVDLGSVLDFQKLFALASNSSCYGPSLAYATHENALFGSASGTLPGGDLGLWLEYENGTEPCVTAQLSRRVRGIKNQSMQGLLMMAAMRRTVAASSALAMPAASVTTDLTVEFETLLHGYVAFAAFDVSAATISLDTTGAIYTYRLALDNGATGTARKVGEIIMTHTPGSSSSAFSGVLKIAAFSLSSDAAMGCNDVKDSATGMFQVANVGTLRYTRSGTALSFSSRSGNYCGHPSSTASSAYGAEVASYTPAGELDPTVALTSSTRGSIKGWIGSFSRFAGDFELESVEGDFLYGWQAGTQDGRSRMLALNATYNSVTDVRTVQGFFGFGADIGTSDGSMLGMICNWAGPGNNHNPVAKFQSQVAALSPTADRFTIASGGSKITYAPTNSCNSTTTQFDANVDHTLAAGEGAPTVNNLDVPSGPNSVEQEIEARGFLSPALY
jgi:hypothetical protein